MHISGKRKLGRLVERLFVLTCLSAVIVPLAVLVLLLGSVAIDSIERLNWGFITGYPSRHATSAGILPSLVGSICLVTLTATLALPLGVGSAIYLEEFSKRSRLSRIIELNIANLAGVPSIIYGLLGLGLFVRFLGLGRSLLAGGATMALLVLPIVIVASREALKNVPNFLREGSIALGATRWQTIRRVVLPLALPGILTGTILSVTRAIGETAPLIVVGALTYVTFLPDGLNSSFTALPIQIFNWVSRPQKAFLANAAAAILVLLITMMLLNATAIILRNRLQSKN